MLESFSLKLVFRFSTGQLSNRKSTELSSRKVTNPMVPALLLLFGELRTNLHLEDQVLEPDCGSTFIFFFQQLFH